MNEVARPAAAARRFARLTRLAPPDRVSSTMRRSLDPDNGSVSLIALLSLGPAEAAHATEQWGTTTQSSPQGPNNVNVVNVPTVTVGNASLQPVPVKEQVNGPVHLNFSLAIAEGFGSALATYDVPAGKQFVVEHFAAHCVSSSQPMEVIAFLSSQQADLTFLSTRSVPFVFGQNLNTGAAPVKAYVTQGSVRGQVGRNGASAAPLLCWAT